MNEQITPQTPAEGILLQSDHEDSKFYEVSCLCGTPEHAIVVNIDAEPDLKQVSMSIYVDVFVPLWKEKFSLYEDDWNSWWKYDFKKFVNRVYNRAVLVKQALFNDTISMSADLIMSEQQAVNFAHTILQSLEDVKLGAEAIEARKQERIKARKEELTENGSV